MHKLQQANIGLYYLKTKDQFTPLVTIVANIISRYTSAGYKIACVDCKKKNTQRHPSLKIILKIVKGNHLRNYHATEEEILNDKYIFGPETGLLKIKTLIKNPARVNFWLVPIPDVLM